MWADRIDAGTSSTSAGARGPLGRLVLQLLVALPLVSGLAGPASAQGSRGEVWQPQGEATRGGPGSSAAIDENLSSGFAKDRRDKEARADRLMRSVFEPLMSGRAVALRVSETRPYARSSVNRIGWVDDQVSRWQAPTVIVIEIESRLSPEYLAGLQDTLGELSAWKDAQSISGHNSDEVNRKLPAPALATNRNWDLSVNVFAAPEQSAEAWSVWRYLMAGLRSDVRSRTGLGDPAPRRYPPNPAMTVCVRNDEDAVLQEAAFSASNRIGRALVVALDPEIAAFASPAGLLAEPLSWHHFISGMSGAIYIPQFRRFAVVMALSEDAEANGRRITVSLQAQR